MQRASAKPHTLELAKCTAGNKAQQWKFDKTKQTIESLDSPGQCIDGSGATGPITKTNVWARNLTNGALAVVFINAGTVAAPVPCNKACFAAMGVRSTANFSARDLWTHTDNGTVTAAAGLTVTVAPSAAVMYKLTPA